MTVALAERSTEEALVWLAWFVDRDWPERFRNGRCDPSWGVQDVLSAEQCREAALVLEAIDARREAVEASVAGGALLNA